MEYKHLEQCNDLAELYAEIRINIIRVNNAFCKKQHEADVKYCLDLFDMFEEPSIDLDRILGLALLLEGTAESLADEPEAAHWEALKNIAYRLEKEMADLDAPR